MGRPPFPRPGDALRRPGRRIRAWSTNSRTVSLFTSSSWRSTPRSRPVISEPSGPPTSTTGTTSSWAGTASTAWRRGIRGRIPWSIPPIFRPSTGLSFLNTGNDLIYAAGLLYRYRGEAGALRWAKHLARQYVRARHPQTGLGAYQFTQPRQTAETADDTKTTSNFGDRAKRQFGPEFGEIALEGNVLLFHHASTIYGENALVQLRLAAELGAEAGDFLEWTRQGLTSFAKYAYDEATNAVKPMFTDGQDLTGYVLRRDGYFGQAGQVLQREQADGRFLLSFVRCYLQTKDDYLWRVARQIGRGNGLGDLGTAPGVEVRPALGTECADVWALFAVLDLHRATGCPDYLALAEAIGARIERATFHHGYFLPGPDYAYAKLDTVEPLALLALEAAKQGRPEAVPVFLGGRGFIHGDYYYPDGRVENIKDYVLYERRVG